MRTTPTLAKGPCPALQPVLEAFDDDARVRRSKMFGSSGLQVDGKFFLTFRDAAPVLKLPEKRVNELVEAGLGQRFSPGGGRLMREWVRLSGGEGEWLSLAREAWQFVGNLAQREAKSR